MIFEECCIYNSELIANGSLIIDKKYLQVSKSTHSTLSNINRNGFITCDSQDGIEEIHWLHEERPYIAGFIRKSKMDKINCLISSNQNFKLIIHGIATADYNFDNYITVTRYKFFNTNFHKEFDETFQYGKSITRIYYDWDQYEINSDVEDLKLINESDILRITIIDFRWNYSAMNNDGLFTLISKCLS